MTLVSLPVGAPASPPVERWGLLPLHVGDTARHMMMTDQLVRSASIRGPFVWWHATNTPTVLVGPSVMPASMPDSPAGLPVIRRPTGGGAVLVGPGVLGLDIALPENHRLLTGDVVRDYEWIGRVWERTLNALDIKALCLSVENARSLTRQACLTADASLACFGTYSPYEVVSGGRKVLGLSQVRRAGGVLFSSAVHIDAHPGALASELPLNPSRRRRLAVHLTRTSASLNEVAASPITPLDVMRVFRRSLGTVHSVRLTTSSWGQF